jgi:hypothetical protein
MSIIPVYLKHQIIDNLNNILNIKDDAWLNLDNEIKIKIIHNLCNSLNNPKNIFLSKISVPLKHLRPKKIIQLCGINKQINKVIFNEYQNNLLKINQDFRNIYNSKNKNYSFANLSKINYDILLNNFNYNIYNFLMSNIKIINYELFYNNLIGKTHNKIITDKNNQDKIEIKSINCNEKLFYIEFNNNIILEFELYLTSEKITNNIPAKYKINLINIF